MSQSGDPWKKRNFWVLFVQTVVLFFTLLAAVKIGCRQNEINQALLDLTSQPSLEVIYRTDHIYLRNMATTNLTLWGVKQDDQSVEWLEPGPHLMPPGTSHTVAVTQEFQDAINRKLTHVDKVQGRANFYLENADNVKWVEEVLATHKLQNGEWTPNTRILRVYRYNWSELLENKGKKAPEKAP